MAEHRTLRSFLTNAGQGLFAVIDGAQFDNLPAALFDLDFVHRPLYLDRGSGTQDQVRTGPQLVWLDRDCTAQRIDGADKCFPVEDAVIDRLLDLVGDRPAMVFWQCTSGGEVLYRHLRGINKVLYPREEHLDGDGPIPESGHELVVFRHADSNVMAQIGPVLSWAGLSRLLGPAQMILHAADADWSEKPMRIQRDAHMPPAPVGPLRIGREEIRAIEAKRRDAIVRQRVAYLQQTCPQETEGASADALAEHIRISADTGRALGLVSEAAHCRWAYLMVATRGEIAKSPEVSTYIRHGGADPDLQMRRVMDSTLQALRRQRAMLGSGAAP